METGCYRDGHGDRYPWWRLYESSRPRLTGRAMAQLAECYACPGDGCGFDARRGDYRRAAARGGFDTAQVLAILPHGTGEVKVVHGGLEILADNGVDKTIIANAAAVVRLDLP